MPQENLTYHLRYSDYDDVSGEGNDDDLNDDWPFSWQNLTYLQQVWWCWEGDGGTDMMVFSDIVL